MSDPKAMDRVEYFLSGDYSGNQVAADVVLNTVHDWLLAKAHMAEVGRQLVDFLVGWQAAHRDETLAIGDKVYYAGKTKNWKIIPDQIPALLQKINEHAAGDPEYFAQFLAADSIKHGFVKDQLGEEARDAAFRETESENYSLKSIDRNRSKRKK